MPVCKRFFFYPERHGMLLKLSYLQYDVIFLGASSPHMCKSPLSTICTALEKKKKKRNVNSLLSSIISALGMNDRKAAAQQMMSFCLMTTSFNQKIEKFRRPEEDIFLKCF